MKNQLKELALLSLIIDMDLFYVISFRDNEITLQGSINNKTIKDLFSAGYVLTSNKEGWITYTNNQLRIVLT